MPAHMQPQLLLSGVPYPLVASPCCLPPQDDPLSWQQLARRIGDVDQARSIGLRSYAGFFEDIDDISLVPALRNAGYDAEADFASLINAEVTLGREVSATGALGGVGWVLGWLSVSPCDSPLRIALLCPAIGLELTRCLSPSLRPTPAVLSAGAACVPAGRHALQVARLLQLQGRGWSAFPHRSPPL